MLCNTFKLDRLFGWQTVAFAVQQFEVVLVEFLVVVKVFIHGAVEVDLEVAHFEIFLEVEIVDLTLFAYV